jgi:AcrR family transcriptional regulator
MRHTTDRLAGGGLMISEERPRRRGSTTSMTRATILDAAEALMLEDGYAAVTYRAVAARADVAPGLVQYYFPALDELFLALLQRNTDRVVEQMAATAETDQPLRAIWRYASNRRGCTLMMEFMALANHRKLVRQQLGRGGERVRRAQLDVLTRRWPDYQLDNQDMTPAALLFLMNSIPRMMLLEDAFGTKTGHAETRQLISRFLDRVEPRSSRRRGSQATIASSRSNRVRASGQ